MVYSINQLIVLHTYRGPDNNIIILPQIVDLDGRKEQN